MAENSGRDIEKVSGIQIAEELSLLPVFAIFA
jgi:hypothetical protein